MYRLLDFLPGSRDAKRLLIDQAMIREGFVPATSLSPNDVFVIGYPKSGNTWVQILIAIIMFGVDLDCVPFGVILDIVPDLSARNYFRRHSNPMFFKHHALPAPEYKRVVYLLRDGRDVMVSYKHYREVLDRKEYDFSAFVSPDNPLWPCHWQQHLEAWAANPYGADIFQLRYEDLLADPVEQLRKLCAFAGVSRSDARLQAAVDATSIQALRKKEATEGNLDPAYKSSKPFFRRGTVGSHADEMPAEALKIFLDQAAPTLRRFGYDV